MIQIDKKNNLVIAEDGTKYNIGSPEAFHILSQLWLRSGWDVKYEYTFTWMGRPIIQLPEDMFRIQEIIYNLKPDVIIETGIAHGGSSVFYANLCKVIGRGSVISIDIEIRPHNLKAIMEHELFEYITLIEGSSVDRQVVDKVYSMIRPQEKVIVLLDSNHTKAHVLAELNAYSGLVTTGSYIVAFDGWMENLAGAPRSKDDWGWNNPKAAVIEFIKSHNNFIVEEPQFKFNESFIMERVTACPNAFLKRIK